MRTEVDTTSEPRASARAVLRAPTGFMTGWILRAMLACVALIPATHAGDADEDALTQDVVLRALVDELDRGMKELKLEDLERPYFIEYVLHDGAHTEIVGVLGSLTRNSHRRYRHLESGIRVGSYTLDNTNFRAGYGGGRGFGGYGGASLPIEDDYNAIRQSIWWSTDRQYKRVVEALATKRAFMESKVIEDKPDDFSRETPTVYFGDPVDTRVNIAALKERVRAVSAVFRDAPQIKRSAVTLSVRRGNRYLINSEGTRIRTPIQACSLRIGATVQADDGMELSDSITIHKHGPDDLPPTDEIVRQCREMMEELIAIRGAPMLEAYTGPVLFEPAAATAVFSRGMANRFLGGQRAVGSRTRPGDFAKKLGKRVLPRFMDVFDDPTRETLAEEVVLGHYRYDGQGVAPSRVQLVEKGRLKAMLMSRNPSKDFSRSTGHGRGGGRSKGSVGCMVVEIRDASDAEELKEALMEACADEDLEYGIRVVSMASAGGRRRGSTGAPLSMFKVYPDGREERVRGAEIARIDLKAFKRVLAAGDTPHVYNSGGLSSRTLSVPALLFEELDLAAIDRDFDKPPILTTPLARGD